MNIISHNTSLSLVTVELNTFPFIFSASFSVIVNNLDCIITYYSTFKDVAHKVCLKSLLFYSKNGGHSCFKFNPRSRGAHN